MTGSSCSKCSFGFTTLSTGATNSSMCFHDKSLLLSLYLKSISSLYARYKVDSYEKTSNTWKDTSGNNRHLYAIDSTGLSVESLTNNGKHFNVIRGTPDTKIQFLCNSGLSSYTLFNVARYIENGRRERILTTDATCDYWGNWLSGFW